MGKLGGKELGYGSDLDLVYVFDDPAGKRENYGRPGQRLNTWLSSRTPAEYLRNRSTPATQWRFGPARSLRSRLSATTSFTPPGSGSTGLTCARLSPAILLSAIASKSAPRKSSAERDPTRLCDEVVAMRRKMLDAHPRTPGEFDIKQDPGGIIDVEFIVQYLVLAHARRHPELWGNLVTSPCSPWLPISDRSPRTCRRRARRLS